MNQRGQALIEALIVTPLLVSGLVLMLSLSYFGFASAWIGYQMDQSLFCLAEGRSENVCTARFRSFIHLGLPSGQVTNLKVEEIKEDFWKMNVEWVWMNQRVSKKKILKWGSQVWRS